MQSEDKNEKSEAQKDFDETYITSSEIMQDLHVTRPAILYARRSGKLPGAIVVNNGRLFVWRRAEIQPYLDAWKIMLTASKSE